MFELLLFTICKNLQVQRYKSRVELRARFLKSDWIKGLGSGWLYLTVTLSSGNKREFRPRKINIKSIGFFFDILKKV